MKLTKNKQYIKMKIGNTDVVLTDMGSGKGAILVRNYDYGSFSYTWGAMGSSLKEFLLDINSDYFASKLCVNANEFCIKGTLANLRREIKGVLPWYEFTEGQKEMRDAIKKNLSYCVNERQFVSECFDLHKYLVIPEYGYRKEEEFKEEIEGVFNTDPWNYISTKPTKQYKWLTKIHGKIKKELSK